MDYAGDAIHFYDVLDILFKRQSVESNLEFAIAAGTPAQAARLVAASGEAAAIVHNDAEEEVRAVVADQVSATLQMLLKGVFGVVGPELDVVD